MPLAAPSPRFDAAAYLDREARQTERHEYLDGEVFAMAGASRAHATVAGNIFMALRNHLRGGPCSVFIAGMKLHVQADKAFYYPDVFVTCAESDRAQDQYMSAPSLVVEVLSPSTSAYDRGGKFASYRKLPTLREYVLIDPERLSVDLFRRHEDGHWALYPAEAGQTVAFDSVDLRLPIEALYEDVDLQAGRATGHP
ncbi:Uma2 family endonuclease [Thauera butanivorans]|uniref:Uma2 family endonuclease n=1 Tax=Thauera butanivorans TaxID=86174 RepID=UPI003AB7ECA0